VARKPVSIEIVEEDGSRAVIRTYADGAEVRAPVDPSKKVSSVCASAGSGRSTALGLFIDRNFRRDVLTG
jgi:hypothetical protein